MENGNHYRVKHSMVFNEIKMCYSTMLKFYNEVEQMKSAVVGGGSGVNEVSPDVDFFIIYLGGGLMRRRRYFILINI